MCTHSEIQNKLSRSRKLFDLQLNLKNDECCKDFSPFNIDPDKAIIVMKIWVFFFFFFYICTRAYHVGKLIGFASP